MDWYGAGERSVEIASGCAVWYHPGLPVLPLRWLLVRDPESQFRAQAFLSTDTDADPVDMLTWFVRRWTVEVTFAEVRRHLGVETQRQWADKAIARTTPLLLALFSILTLIADQIHQENGIVVRSARWYRKDHITFTDALAAVRRHIWTQQTFAMSPPDRHPQQTPAGAFDRLVNLACYAA